MNWKMAKGEFRIPRRLVFASAIVATLTLGGIARAGLVITPTFDSTITSDSNAATIEASINAAISRVEADMNNNVTVKIDFKVSTSGLGGSQTTEYGTTYSNYRSLLASKQSLSVNDVIALSHLPVQSANPVNGNSSSSSIVATSSLLRALGQSTPGAITISGTPGTFDGVISLNTSLCNLSRTGTQNSNFYDLQAVAGHEIDEVLGIGGTGSRLTTNGTFSPSGSIGVLDLDRYASNGTRSYTISASTSAYFSIDGGKTNWIYFDQNNLGGDFADWGNSTPNSGTGNTPPQLQDAFGSPGTQVDIGSFEIAALDVEGYDLTPQGTSAEATIPSAPEPASSGILLAATIGLLVRRRRPEMPQLPLIA